MNEAQAVHAAAGQQYRSVFRAGLFEGQTMIVTGGGSGIGRCTAHELASLGAKVLVTGRQRAALERVVAEIREDGGRAEAYDFDIRDEDAVVAKVQDMVSAHGPIHGLVNNAGGQFPSPLAGLSKKGFDAVVSSNLTGGFLMAREIYKQSMRRHGGAIVNMIAEMWGGWPLMAHSGAARAAMFNLTQSAALEWAVAGIRVNCVAPGYVASSGLDRYDPEVARPMIENLRRIAPLKRLAEEAEISAAIVFLLSPASAFITGTCLRIDGGTSLGAKAYPLPDHAKSVPFQGFHRAIRPKALDPA